MKELSKVIYKKLSPLVVKVLVKLGITANQITIFNIFFMTLGAGYCFAAQRYWLALLICGISAALDYADGDVAAATTGYTATGAWIDPFGDIIKQNGIMGAIALGTHMPPLIIVIFFIANATLNLVSLYYNNTFGFDSSKGNELFRELMDKKPTLFNKVLKNIIDPTSSWPGLYLGTVRYLIITGIVFGIMPVIFLVITGINCFKAVFMFVIYALHLSECKILWLLQVLAALDKNRKEFYDIRKT